MYAPEIAASSARFEWVGDTDAIASYKAPILHEPPAYKRNFCARCGSPLPVLLEDAGYAILHAGILDGDPALRVFRHAFTGQRSPCCEITDTAPQYAGQPPPPDQSDLIP